LVLAIITPADLGNQRYETREGRIRFFAAERAVFVVGGYDSNHQICQIIFSKKDGSIFVSTPYFGSGSGVVTSASIGSGPPFTISLNEGGKVTSHLVKFSHHPDGRVHFSQAGKVKTEIHRTSFPLATTIGEVFDLHIYHPTGFASLDLAKRKTDRVYLRNVFRGGLPTAITVVGKWRRKASIEANTDPPTGVVPPVTTMKHRKTGAESVVSLLGQPAGWPLTDHILMLTCYPTTPLENITETTMILIGGWDPHEVPESGIEVKQTGCLVWMYPQLEPEKLAARIGSIDWTKPEGAV